MLVPDSGIPGGERVKLLDFGIAKLSTLDTINPQTRTGTIIGTALYMSPEQCRGASDIDGKADVYSLGVMLYQMLTGRPPFVGANEIATVAMHLFEPPPKLAATAEKVHPGLAALIDGMLAKDPAQRPAMTEVMSGLQQLLRESYPDQEHALQPIVERSPSKRTAEAMLELSPAQLSTNPTTLGSSVGASVYARKRRAGVARAVWVGAPLGVLLIASVAWWSTRESKTPAESGAALQATALPKTAELPKEAKEAAPVRWSIASRPAGASVVRVADQRQLGQTPWTMEQPAQPGRTELLLRLSGYNDRVVALDASRSSELTVKLDRSSASAEPAERPTRGGSGSAAGKRHAARHKPKAAPADRPAAAPPPAPKAPPPQVPHATQTKLID